MEPEQNSLDNQISQEDTDLSAKYQAVLDQYAKELGGDIPTPPSPPPATSDPVLELPPVTQSIPKKENNIFKYFFYLSLLIFLGVIGAVIYSLFITANSNSSANSSSPHPSTFVTQSPPTATIRYCEVNDQKIPVGSTFPSADNCNTCSCADDLTISCTEKACATKPTITATSAPTKKESMKTYKDTKYGFQFDCPVTAKYLLEVSSIDGKTIPFKQESCTRDGVKVTISLFDNAVDRAFGNSFSKISPDSKYVVTISSSDEQLQSQVSTSFKFN